MDNIEFRVVRHVDAAGKERFCIHQVQFDSAGVPNAISEQLAVEHESVETLTHILIHMLGSLTKEVIDYNKAFVKSEVDTSVDAAFNLIQPKKN